MAAAYVKEIGKNTKNTAGSTLVITAGATAGAGNMVVLRGIGGGGVAPSTVTDSRGNTWTIDKTHASSPRVFIASTLQNAAAIQSGDTITVTFASSVTPAAAIVDEFSGIAAASRVDQTQSATATTTNRDAGTTGTLSQAAELVVAAFGSGAPETAAWTHGSGYSDFTTAFLNSTTTIIMVEGEYQIVAATTAVHPTATGITMNSNGVVVTYKAAGGTVQTLTVATVNGVSTVSASVKRTRSRSAAVSCAATVSLSALRRTRARSATIAGQASVSCSVKRIRARSAAIAGSAAVSASLKRTRARTAAVSGQATVSCSIRRTRALSAAVAGSASVSASVKRTRARSAAISGTATVVCTIRRTRTFSATINGAAAITAGLGGQTRLLRPTVHGSATVSAAVVRRRALGAAVAATATVSAALSRSRALGPQITGTATLSSAIVLLRGLTATVAGATDVSCVITGTRAPVSINLRIGTPTNGWHVADPVSGWKVGVPA